MATGSDFGTIEGAVLFGIWLAYAVYRFQSSSKPAEESTDSSQYDSVRPGLALLKQKDPGFDEGNFLERARAVALKAQNSRHGGGGAPALRGLASDGFIESLRAGAAVDAAAAVRKSLKGLSVDRVVVRAVESDRFFDTIHVELAARVRMDEAWEATGAPVQDALYRGDAEREIWTFVRRPGSRTLGKPGALEGRCPNCGAPLEVLDAGLCGACKSWINSGEFDWVLTHVASDKSWVSPAMRTPDPELTALAETDASANLYALEDRALIAFWRWKLAVVSKDAGGLRAIAADESCGGLARLAQTQDPRRFDFIVESVALAAFKTGSTDDQARLRVDWSARSYDPARLASHDAAGKEIFTFRRKHGVVADGRSGLCSLRCHNCGAPESGPEQTSCRYCGTAFNDGQRQWALSGIEELRA